MCLIFVTGESRCVSKVGKIDEDVFIQQGKKGCRAVIPAVASKGRFTT